MAWTATNIILILLTAMVAFPDEALDLIKRARRWLREDYQRRSTPEEWERDKHEWDDLD